MSRDVEASGSKSGSPSDGLDKGVAIETQRAGESHRNVIRHLWVEIVYS